MNVDHVLVVFSLSWILCAKLSAAVDNTGQEDDLWCDSIIECSLPSFVEEFLKHRCRSKKKSVSKAGSGRRKYITSTCSTTKSGLKECYLSLDNIDLSAMNQLNTTLHQASKEGNLRVVQHIVSHKLEDMNTLDKSGRTPIMVAAVKKQRAVFDYFLCLKADLSTVDVDHNNLLQLACTWGDIEVMTSILLKGTFDLEYRGRNDSTALMQAARAGNIGVFDLLQRRNCNLKTKDLPQNNILHAACKSGVVDMVKHVLSLDVVSKESTNGFGETPTHVAALSGHKAVFFLLIKQGCKLNAEPIDNKSTILHAASKGGNVDIVKYVLSHVKVGIESRDVYGLTPILVAATRETFAVLQNKGCDMKAVDKYNNNILHKACYFGHVDMVKYIISLKIVNIDSKGRHGYAPLMIAARDGYIDVFDILLRGGADMATEDEDENNVLHTACEYGRVEMVKHLLTINIRDRMKTNKYGKTPVEVAELGGFSHVVEIMEKYKLPDNHLTSTRQPSDHHQTTI